MQQILFISYFLYLAFISFRDAQNPYSNSDSESL